MAAQTITEIYRTQEVKEKYQFTAAVTIMYFGETATLQGLSGRFSKDCWLELKDYLVSRGVRDVYYYRRGKRVHHQYSGT